jgi:hypothetical protein
MSGVIRTSRLRLSALVVMSLLPIRGATGRQAYKGPSGDISGTWSDACSCPITCPCWQTGRANVRHCLNVQVFQPSAANSASAEATFVVVAISDGYWAPSQSQYTLYFDDSADPLMTRRLNDFFQKYYGINSSDSKRVAIKMTVSRRARQVSIPGILDYNIEPIPQTTLSHAVRDHLYTWLVNAEQWRTKALRYHPARGRVTTYKGTNSLIGEFRLTAQELRLARPFPAFCLPRRAENDSEADDREERLPPSPACRRTIDWPKTGPRFALSLNR